MEDLSNERCGLGTLAKKTQKTVLVIIINPVSTIFMYLDERVQDKIWCTE